MTSSRSTKKAPPKPSRNVAIVSPASPATDARSLESAIRYLKKRGLTATFNRAAALREGYLAGPDKVRALDLTTVLSDPDMEGVFASRGGYGSMRILPLLDMERISQTPKYIVGFSDVSAILCHLYEKTPHWCIHAPAMISLTKKDAHPKNAELLFKILNGELTKYNLCAEYEREDKSIEVLRHGNCCGLLVGGNLAVLAALCGTPYFPNLRGKILFFEEVGEAPYRLDRCLTQLLLAGHLEGVEGILIGTLERCNPPRTGPGTLNALTVIRKCLIELGIPILANLPFGHGHENAPIPLGSLVEVTSRNREIIINIDTPSWLTEKLAASKSSSEKT